MAGIRFQLDLFIPEDVYLAIPSATRSAIRDRIRQLRAFAKTIKAGGAEELTIKARWHRCYHDEPAPRPCEPEQDV